MTRFALIRDYENPELPLALRLPSLARRFKCLKGASGLTPWSPEVFFSWLQSKGKQTATWHAGLLILNLSGCGPWERFDSIRAVEVWDEQDRAVFATWVRSWQRS